VVCVFWGGGDLTGCERLLKVEWGWGGGTPPVSVSKELLLKGRRTRIGFVFISGGGGNSGSKEQQTREPATCWHAHRRQRMHACHVGLQASMQVHASAVAADASSGSCQLQFAVCLYSPPQSTTLP
jgi:hypothetical protein